MRENPFREKILNGYYSGKTYGEMSDEYGVTRSSVAGIINRHRHDRPSSDRICNFRQFGKFASICEAARASGMSEWKFKKINGI